MGDLKMNVMSDNIEWFNDNVSVVSYMMNWKADIEKSLLLDKNVYIWGLFGYTQSDS